MKWMIFIHDHEHEHWRSSQPRLLFHVILTCCVSCFLTHSCISFSMWKHLCCFVLIHTEWKTATFYSQWQSPEASMFLPGIKTHGLSEKQGGDFLSATTITTTTNTTKKSQRGDGGCFWRGGIHDCQHVFLKHVHLYFISTDWAFALYNVSAQKMTELKERKQTFYSSSKKKFQQMGYFRKRKKTSRSPYWLLIGSPSSPSLKLNTISSLVVPHSSTVWFTMTASCWQLLFRQQWQQLVGLLLISTSNCQRLKAGS